MSNDVVPVAWAIWRELPGGDDLCLYNEAITTVAALQSRIAESEKDAARYRYASARFVLRDKYSKNDEVTCIGVGEWNFHIDAAIDAAIEATK